MGDGDVKESTKDSDSDSDSERIEEVVFMDDMVMETIRDYC